MTATSAHCMLLESQIRMLRCALSRVLSELPKEISPEALCDASGCEVASVQAARVTLEMTK